MKKQFILAALALLLCEIPQGQAQTFRVKKVKGRQALIEVTQGELEPNQQYSLRGSSNSSSGTDRGMVVGVEGLNFAFTSKSSDSGGSTSSLSRLEFSGSFGWNLGHIEAGPLISFVSSSGGTSTSLLGAGGYLDYNLTANRPGVSWIWGVFGSAQITSQDAGGAKTTGSKLDVGGFLKWFPFNEWLCLRTNLKLEMSDSKSDLASSKDTSFILNAGVSTYF